MLRRRSGKSKAEDLRERLHIELVAKLSTVEGSDNAKDDWKAGMTVQRVCE